MDQLSYTVREYQPGDEEAILASFNRIFAEVDPGFTPRSLRQWRWEFLENPSGWTIFLAESEQGEIVSQFAGIPQRYKLEDQTTRIIHGVDSFIDPRFRVGLKNPCLVETGKRFFEHYCGLEAGRSPMMWGYPIWPAWRIGKTFFDEQIVRTESKLVGRVESLRPEAAPGVEVEAVERFPEEVDALFARASEPHACIAIRDRAQLDWRFPERPDRDYRIGLARRDGQLVGYAVYTLGHFDDVACALIADWLTQPGDAAAGHALRHWLAQLARAEGREELTLLVPDTTAEWLDFQHAGFRVRPTKYWTASTSWIKRGSMSWLYRNWYYTLEDTDLC